MIDPTPDLGRFESYEQACREFRWRVPEQFNIACAISKRHRDAVTRTALSDVRPGGINTYSFGGIDFLSDKFASLLAESGVRQGDAVAVILFQSAALLVAQFGALKLGAVVAPLSPSLPAQTLQRALRECRARAIVACEAALVKIVEATASEHLFLVQDYSQGSHSGDKQKNFWRGINRASSDFTAAQTSSNSPAFVFFLSDRKGGLTGVTHSHRSFIGQLTAFEMYNNFSGCEDSVFWTASDWASPQVLLGIIIPALWYGWSVVAQDSLSFSGDESLNLIENCEVTDAFISSPDIKELRRVEGAARPRYDLKLRRILTTPDAFTSTLQDWAAESLGASMHAAYGTPETGIIATSCEKWFTSAVGTSASAAGTSMKATPGRSIEIVDEQGDTKPAGHRGRVALLRPDPALFLSYWNDSEKTSSAFAGDWFLTGDEGYKNEDGELHVSPSSIELGG